MNPVDFTILDAVAVAWFLACWVGVAALSRWRAHTRMGLMEALGSYRRLWMERLSERENHQADAAVLGNLVRGALFFASTTVFIIGGLFAFLGSIHKVIDVVGEVPFADSVSVLRWEARTLLLIYIFVYAFFKFTWSSWQYNALSIMVGAVPGPGTAAAVREPFVAAAADIAILAGESFNHGIRAYYFSIAAVSWLLHPVALIVVATWVAAVLYRREFLSPTLTALLRRDGAGARAPSG